MMTLLEFLNVLGRATWAPVWLPLLAWTALAIPLWLVLKATRRLHPRAEYRLLQVLLAALPASLLATVLFDLLPTSVAMAPSRALTVTVFPAVKAPIVPSASAPTWQWTQAVGLFTVAGGTAAVVGLARLVLDIATAIRVRRSLSGLEIASAQAQATRIAHRLGTNRPFRVCLTPATSVPATLGGLCPIICLPDRDPVGFHALACCPSRSRRYPGRM